MKLRIVILERMSASLHSLADIVVINMVCWVDFINASACIIFILRFSSLNIVKERI